MRGRGGDAGDEVAKDAGLDWEAGVGVVCEERPRRGRVEVQRKCLGRGWCERREPHSWGHVRGPRLSKRSGGVR